jgi:RNA polymerase sigma-70 factor, ECF subfamily
MERINRAPQSILVKHGTRRAIERGTVDQTGLIERASRGDHEAFGVLVGGHLARLDTAARLILRDPELARDAVQEATLRAWKNLRGLRDPDRFDAWLHRLTVNACLDLARKRRNRIFEVELTPLHDAPAPDATSTVADALYVERMLAAVEPAQRAVVVLHYYLDLSLPETAAALGIPVGTAKSRLNRALAAMRITVAGEDVLIGSAAQERFA